MQIARRLFVLVSALAALTGASEEAAPADSAVVTLTTENFQSFIDEHPVVLVEFYAPWCGHCKKLAPEYEEAAKYLKKNDGVPLAKVDATTEKDLATKYSVQGFPTLSLFRKGVPEPYQGGRTKKAIIEWLESAAGPTVVEVDTYENAVAKAKDLAAAFIARVPSKDSEAYKIYDEVASNSRLMGKFYVTIVAGVSPATIEVHRTGEEMTQVKLEKADKLAAWVKVESFPLFGAVSGENFAKYSERSDSWLWVAAQPDAFDTVAPAVRKVSKNYREEYNFVFLDAKAHEQHAKSMGLETFPSIAMQTPAGRYLFTGEISEKSLTKFIEAVRAGKVEKNIKSEPVPEKNDEDVKVVVGKTFEEMVINKDKDVLLEVYAPWCGHCKHLQPIYEEFAASVKASDHLTVAKMDGTANEPTTQGFEFHGFPTLFFVKAGESKPMPFDGARTVEGFQQFVKTHAKFPVSFEEPTKDEL